MSDVKKKPQRSNLCFKILEQQTQEFVNAVTKLLIILVKVLYHQRTTRTSQAFRTPFCKK